MSEYWRKFNRIYIQKQRRHIGNVGTIEEYS